MRITSAIVGIAFGLAASTALAAPETKMMDTDLGSVLVDADGMTLYIFDNDEPGKTNCYEQCAVNWPPFLAADGAMAEGDYTLVERTDGGAMWAFKGMPLYYWVGDVEPGDTTGDGVGGVWHVVK